MLRRLFLTLFLAFISGCGNGPKVSVYLSNPEVGGMDFYDPNAGHGGFVPYSATDKFVCFTPPDAQTLVSACGINDEKLAQIVKAYRLPKELLVQR